MSERIVKAIMTHCEWGVEGLRLDPPRTSNSQAAERIVELMASSMALDNQAFTDFIVLVLETRTSLNEIMSAAERCDYKEWSV